MAKDPHQDGKFFPGLKQWALLKFFFFLNDEVRSEKSPCRSLPATPVCSPFHCCLLTLFHESVHDICNICEAGVVFNRQWLYCSSIEVYLFKRRDRESKILRKTETLGWLKHLCWSSCCQYTYHHIQLMISRNGSIPNIIANWKISKSRTFIFFFQNVICSLGTSII